MDTGRVGSSGLPGSWLHPMRHRPLYWHPQLCPELDDVSAQPLAPRQHTCKLLLIPSCDLVNDTKKACDSGLQAITCPSAAMLSLSATCQCCQAG